MKIKIIEVAGLEPAIRAMRLPMKSGEKSDSFVCHSTLNQIEEEYCKTCPHRRHVILSTPRSDHDVLFECRKDAPEYIIGPKDHSLSMKLIQAGSSHRKHIRLIDAWMEIQAPLYWWNEFDTYRLGVDKVSESTMHTLTKHEITTDDFELDEWKDPETGDLPKPLEDFIDWIERWRKISDVQKLKEVLNIRISADPHREMQL